jgi:Trehalose-phosphatase
LSSKQLSRITTLRFVLFARRLHRLLFTLSPTVSPLFPAIPPMI